MARQTAVQNLSFDFALRNIKKGVETAKLLSFVYIYIYISPLCSIVCVSETWMFTKSLPDTMHIKFSPSSEDWRLHSVCRWECLPLWRIMDGICGNINQFIHTYMPGRSRDWKRTHKDNFEKNKCPCQERERYICPAQRFKTGFCSRTPVLCRGRKGS